MKAARNLIGKWKSNWYFKLAGIDVHNSAFNLDSLHTYTYIYCVCVYIRDLTVVDVAQRSALFRVLIVSNGLDKASRCDVSGGNSCSVNCVLSLSLVPCPLHSYAPVSLQLIVARVGSAAPQKLTAWQTIYVLRECAWPVCAYVCVCTSKKMWTSDDFTPQLENVCQLY